MHSTPLSLLHRLRRQPDAADWRRLLDLYSPLVVYWLRQLGAKPDETDDLGQDVLIAVWRHLARYEPGKGRFRGWLWTITRNKFLESRRRRMPDAQLADDDSRFHPIDRQQSDDAIEAEHCRYVVHRALELLRDDFAPATWQACWDFVVNGEPAQVVAERHGLTANAVYLAKARILRRLREELAGLVAIPE